MAVIANSSRASHLEYISSHVREEEKSLVSNLTQLDDGCSEFEKFYAEYDMDAETPANGYRSFVSIIDVMFDRIAQQVPATSGKKRQCLQDYGVAAATFVKVMAMMRESRMKGPVYDQSVISNSDIHIIEQVFSMNESDIAPFHKANVGAFWLKEFSAKEKRQASKVISFFTRNWSQRLRMMFSSSYTLHLCTTDAICSDVATFQKLMQMIERFPYNLFMKMASAKYTGITKSTVQIDRTSEWVLSTKDSASPTVIEKTSAKRKGSVRCLIVGPKPKRGQTATLHDGKSLVVHVHGGAFILGKPEQFLPFLAPQVTRLNVPIISIDYGLAPDHRFPTPLQDVLDVYMFLTSGSEKVREMLGFHPTNIVMTGESAGGHISITMRIALLMIAKTGATVMMPAGLSVLFPCAVPAPVGFPSTVFFSFDPVLPAALCAIVFGEYQKMDPQPATGWHRDSGRKQILERMRDRAKDPLFNVLSGSFLEQLKDVQLNMLFCEFDPIMDHGIAIGKRWPGKKRVRLVKGLAHGLTMKLAKIKDELDWFIDGMAQQLGLEDK